MTTKKRPYRGRVYSPLIALETPEDKALVAVFAPVALARYRAALHARPVGMSAHTPQDAEAIQRADGEYGAALQGVLIALAAARARPELEQLGALLASDDAGVRERALLRLHEVRASAPTPSDGPPDSP